MGAGFSSDRSVSFIRFIIMPFSLSFPPFFPFSCRAVGSNTILTHTYTRTHTHTFSLCVSVCLCDVRVRLEVK